MEKNLSLSPLQVKNIFEDIKISHKEYNKLKMEKFKSKNFLKYYPKLTRKLLEREFDKPFSQESLEKIINLLKNSFLVREKIICSSEKIKKNLENER
jgi:hypothetical protein